MIESRFDIRKLPIDLSDECGVPATSRSFGNIIKLAFFRVIRFKNNSGVLVFASVSHCLVDGHGFTLFMSRWAEIARWMQQPQDVHQAPFPKRQYTHDRAVHSIYRSNQTASLDTFTLESMSSGNMLTRWFAWISPETRGRIFKALSNAASRVCYYLHIPSEELENLRTSVQKHAPPGMRYSINDIIVAYVTLLVARAKEKASADWWSRPVPSAVRAAFGAKLGEHTGFLTTVAVNIRPRIEHTGTDKYTGNMSLGKYIWFPQDMVQVEPTDKALSALALKTHQAVLDVDKEYIGQFGHLLNKEPDSYMRLTLCNARHRRKLVISTQVRFAHYKVDFGAGTPLLVRFTPYAFPDVVLVMPGNPEIGGYEITLNLAPEIATHVIQDAGWMKMVDKYDCII
ncbi:hypothetical protein H4S06_002763 [Coemansia sp. BCRC 34490]|nr:hypothetical protein H4S06_002763 [Coemansia sp. BCRC 34490]